MVKPQFRNSGNIESLFVSITHRPTVSLSGSICSGLIYSSNGPVWKCLESDRSAWKNINIYENYMHYEYLSIYLSIYLSQFTNWTVSISDALDQNTIPFFANKMIFYNNIELSNCCTIDQVFRLQTLIFKYWLRDYCSLWGLISNILVR